MRPIAGIIRMLLFLVVLASLFGRESYADSVSFTTSNDPPLVQRVNEGGSDLVTLIEIGSGGRSLKVDGAAGMIYFYASNNAIFRSRLDGGGLQNLCLPSSPALASWQPGRQEIAHVCALLSARC